VRKFTDDHVEQIKEYTFDESALLAIMANGTEIRIYSPLRGVAFERSLLYTIKRQDLGRESSWETLSELLHYENLRSRNVLKKIAHREEEIRDAMVQEEHISQDIENKITDINTDIEAKEEEIQVLKLQKEQLEKQANDAAAKVWESLGLPHGISRISLPHDISQQTTPFTEKSRKVFLKELVEAGLIREGQTLYFFNTQLFKEDQATIISSSNALRYNKDNKIYSISKLAEILLKKHGFKHDDHGVAGPRYWKTYDGKLLNDLNEIIRKKRGDRE
jgi:hypothetical protein